jgi:twinkle protein
MDIRSYLNSKGWQWKESNRGSGPIAVLNCPFCGDMEKKFAISLTDGAWNCLHINRCGRKGSFVQLQRELGDIPLPSDSINMLYGRTSTPKKEYKRPTMPTALLDGRGLKWIEDNRKLTKETIEYFDVRMNERGTGLCWPYYKDGVLVNLKHRAFADKKFYNSKETEPTLFNRDRCASNLERLVICEGEFDCMALHQYGIEAVSVPNGTGDTRWIANEWDYCQRFQEVVLCLDNDAAGWKLRDELIQRFGRYRCRVMRLPFKDANECLIQGVPPEKMKQALEYAESVPPDLLVNASEFIDDVTALFNHPNLVKGVPTAFESLDEILRGWRDQELTIWSGNNGSGKSTILNQVVLDLLLRRVPVCMASLELPPTQYLRWMVMQQTDRQRPDDQQIYEAFQTFGPYLFVVNTHEEITPDRVLDCFTYAARRYGVKHFVVDSLARLSFPLRDENNEHKKFVSDFLSFVKTNNAHGHLVAHPRKGYSDEDKPGKVDVGGTAHITNLAHNVLIMWRPSEEIKERARLKGKEPPDSKLMVVKNREWGTEGAINLSFNPESKKFSALTT